MEFRSDTEANMVREQNRSAVEEFFAHGAHAPMELYHKDCVMVQPFFFPDNPGGRVFPGEGGMPPEAEPDEGEAPPEWTIDWVWGPTTIWGTDDPDYFFAENTGSGRQMRGDGKYYPYSNHYFHTFRFSGGKIIEYREIANPLNLMDAMGVKHDPLPSPEDTMKELMENAGGGK